MKFNILYYVNQFFGQIGGEEQAGTAPIFKEEVIGPAVGFNGLLENKGEVIGTIICGDNYFNENKEDALKTIMKIIKEKNPDMLVAGPAFNAGRYGMACAELANAVVDELNIPVITGMYEENPGVDACRAKAIVVKTGNSATHMRKALPVMADIAKTNQGRRTGTPGRRRIHSSRKKADSVFG